MVQLEGIKKFTTRRMRAYRIKIFTGHNISRVLRNPQEIEMTWLLFSTPCVKTGFVPKLISRLGSFAPQ
jgi:hypothetical protein